MKKEFEKKFEEYKKIRAEKKRLEDDLNREMARNKTYELIKLCSPQSKGRPAVNYQIKLTLPPTPFFLTNTPIHVMDYSGIPRMKSSRYVFENYIIPKYFNIRRIYTNLIADNNPEIRCFYNCVIKQEKTGFRIYIEKEATRQNFVYHLSEWEEFMKLFEYQMEFSMFFGLDHPLIYDYYKGLVEEKDRKRGENYKSVDFQTKNLN